MSDIQIGDIITPHTKRAKGLRPGHPYKVIEIHRGIDGAYDWDDIFLEGVQGKFCEFDFRRY